MVEINDKHGGYQLVNRLRCYSAVSIILDFSQKVYVSVKQSHVAIERTCGFAEQVLKKTAGRFGEQIEVRCGAQLQQLDNACAKRLDTVERFAGSARDAIRAKYERVQGKYQEAQYALLLTRNGLLERLLVAREYLASECEASTAGCEDLTPMRMVMHVTSRMGLRWCNQALQYAGSILLYVIPSPVEDSQSYTILPQEEVQCKQAPVLEIPNGSQLQSEAAEVEAQTAEHIEKSDCAAQVPFAADEEPAVAHDEPMVGSVVAADERNEDEYVTATGTQVGAQSNHLPGEAQAQVDTTEVDADFASCSAFSNTTSQSDTTVNSPEESDVEQATEPDRGAVHFGEPNPS